MNTPHIYIKDDTIHYTAIFSEPSWSLNAGDFIDPTTLTLEIKEPDATLTIYIYGTDPEMVRDSLGHYHADIQVLSGGSFLYYKFISTGIGAGAAEKSCQILTGAF